MMQRLLLAAALAIPAYAQLQLLQFDGTTETPVGGKTYEVGTGAPGDSIETRFHVRNFGAGPINLTNLSVAGAGFRLSAQPSLPYILAPGSVVEFRVLFAPAAVGSYSANVLVNTISVMLRGTAVTAASLSLGPGTTPLSSGAIIDFGKTEPGTSLTQTFLLSNPSTSSITVGAVAVTGPDFQGPLGLSTPLVLPANQSVSFSITFAPSGTLASEGLLTIDQRTFRLTGLGVNPPLPKASIQFDTLNGISARQARISIQLASVSRVAGTGTLTLDFHPSVAGVVDDPAIQFLSGPKRAATVSIGAGASIGTFGTQLNLAFQTGTTAGTITFTLKLPNDTQQATFVIPPATIVFDTATGTRRVSDLDVSLIGFDNTYTASQLRFTFYDSTGKTLAPGAIPYDATAAFRALFSTAVAGGSFAVRATFPVTGDATKVSGVDVEFTNTVGIAKTQRITF